MGGDARSSSYLGARSGLLASAMATAAGLGGAGLGLYIDQLCERVKGF